ncbi:hypothetical protein EV182_002264, partial [Spiromyces aspiralis]
DDKTSNGVSDNKPSDNAAAPPPCDSQSNSQDQLEPVTTGGATVAQASGEDIASEPIPDTLLSSSPNPNASRGASANKPSSDKVVESHQNASSAPIKPSSLHSRQGHLLASSPFLQADRNSLHVSKDDPTKASSAKVAKRVVSPFLQKQDVAKALQPDSPSPVNGKQQPKAKVEFGPRASGSIKELAAKLETKTATSHVQPKEGWMSAFPRPASATATATKPAAAASNSALAAKAQNEARDSDDKGKSENDGDKPCSSHWQDKDRAHCRYCSRQRATQGRWSCHYHNWYCRKTSACRYHYCVQDQGIRCKRLSRKSHTTQYYCHYRHQEVRGGINCLHDGGRIRHPLTPHCPSCRLQAHLHLLDCRGARCRHYQYRNATPTASVSAAAKPGATKPTVGVRRTSAAAPNTSAQRKPPATAVTLPKTPVSARTDLATTISRRLASREAIASRRLTTGSIDTLNKRPIATKSRDTNTSNSTQKDTLTSRRVSSVGLGSASKPAVKPTIPVTASTSNAVKKSTASAVKKPAVTSVTRSSSVASAAAKRVPLTTAATPRATAAASVTTSLATTRRLSMRVSPSTKTGDASTADKKRLTTTRSTTTAKSLTPASAKKAIKPTANPAARVTLSKTSSGSTITNPTNEPSNKVTPEENALVEKEGETKTGTETQPLHEGEAVAEDKDEAEAVTACDTQGDTAALAVPPEQEPTAATETITEEPNADHHGDPVEPDNSEEAAEPELNTQVTDGTTGRDSSEPTEQQEQPEQCPEANVAYSENAEGPVVVKTEEDMDDPIKQGKSEEESISPDNIAAAELSGGHYVVTAEEEKRDEELQGQTPTDTEEPLKDEVLVESGTPAEVADEQEKASVCDPDSVQKDDKPVEDVTEAEQGGAEMTSAVGDNNTASNDAQGSIAEADNVAEEPVTVDEGEAVVDTANAVGADDAPQAPESPTIDNNDAITSLEDRRVSEDHVPEAADEGPSEVEADARITEVSSADNKDDGNESADPKHVNDASENEQNASPSNQPASPNNEDDDEDDEDEDDGEDDHGESKMTSPSPQADKDITPATPGRRNKRRRKRKTRSKKN